MKKDCKKDDMHYPYDRGVRSAKKPKPNIERRIYNALDSAEKIAVRLAQINRILKIERKMKNKKLGRIDKKTGTLMLKKQKKAKRLKRYKRFNYSAASK